MNTKTYMEKFKSNIANSLVLRDGKERQNNLTYKRQKIKYATESAFKQCMFSLNERRMSTDVRTLEVLSRN